jgi:hypothetical protein
VERLQVSQRAIRQIREDSYMILTPTKTSEVEVAYEGMNAEIIPPAAYLEK